MKKNTLILLLFCCTNWIQGQHISDYISLEPLANNPTFQYPEDSHTFHYIIEHGDPLTAGGILPDNCDFAGYIPIAGSSRNGYLGINSELSNGGVTILDINFNTSMKKWETTASEAVDFSGVSGTGRNCSGSVTPWNTLITSEETVTSDVVAPFDGYNDKGWNVEIDPATRTVIDQGGAAGPDKLWALGNFKHENIIVHDNHRTVYQGADSNPGYLYKFVADAAQDLSSGSLYVYKEITASTGEWILLNNTTIAERNSTHSQAGAAGARSFNGIEDVEISPIDGMVYFAVKGENRVYKFQDSDPITGTTVSNFETFVGGMSYDITHKNGVTTTAWGGGNDNLAFDDLGNLWVFQDGGSDYIWTVMLGHTQIDPKVKIFGISPTGAEPTGITFTPDFQYFFMSIQHPSLGNGSITQPDAFGVAVNFDRDVALVVGRQGTLGITLPIELSSFSGEEKKDHVLLNWTTSFEENTDYFIVQRSTNGDIWNDMDKIAAAGNSIGVNSYSSKDYNYGSGIHYYRLKSVDADESFEYSRIISVNHKDIFKNNISISPNPFREKMDIEFPSNIPITATLKIMNTDGKVILNTRINTLENNSTEINTMDMEEGIYFISIQSDDFILTQKVIRIF